MQDRFNKIGLLVKPSPRVTETLQTLIDYLLASGRRVILDQTAAELMQRPELPFQTQEELAASCDLLITVGGDGTLLGAARLLANLQIPLLGINLGRLGFLADISPQAIARSLDSIFAGEYEEEQRFLLSTEILNAGEVKASSLALNDAVIHKWNSARMIEFETYVNGRFVDTQRSDGLIIATPTGSTAYALSGGGPLLEPDLDALLLVPICPHTLSNRPIVVGGDSLIELVVSSATDPANVRVSCDGQDQLVIEANDRIRIGRHPNRIRLIHPQGHDHFDILRAKLGWGEHKSQDASC
ncbi:MAG: NAD(+) kinase [Gammaproteobacteria bacterium]|nr:NAD(+) kinase [Gammaproteobacteria bacterium]